MLCLFPHIHSLVLTIYKRPVSVYFTIPKQIIIFVYVIALGDPLRYVCGVLARNVFF